MWEHNKGFHFVINSPSTTEENLTKHCKHKVKLKLHITPLLCTSWHQLLKT